MFSIFKKKESNKGLFYHTDIHSHVLPGIDDGSRDVDMSMFLVGKMKSWGINRIIATPHVTKDTFENTPSSISDAYSALNDKIATSGVDIEISYSAEYRIDELFKTVVESNQLILFPNDYILVENSFIQAPWEMDDVIYDLKLRGYNPILAHPERYKYYWHKKERYREIHDTGTYFQVNLLSFAGYYGKEVKEMAYWLLENDMIDFMGTDLHHPRHVESIEHFIKSSECNKLAKKLHLLNDTAFI